MTQASISRPRRVLIPVVAGSVLFLLLALGWLVAVKASQAKQCLDDAFGLPFSGAEMTWRGCRVWIESADVGPVLSGPLPDSTTVGAIGVLVLSLLVAGPPYVALGKVVRGAGATSEEDVVPSNPTIWPRTGAVLGVVSLVAGGMALITPPAVFLSVPTGLAAVLVALLAWSLQSSDTHAVRARRLAGIGFLGGAVGIVLGVGVPLLAVA